MDLRLDVSEQGAWSVLQVGGEIDVATAPRLREQLIRLVNDERFRIVVDLEGVDFIDSTGLGVLIGALKRVRTHDGDLVLVCTEPRIVKVFEITGLNQVFQIHASLDDAVAE
ncbi:STAS domain-containing protein [Aquihabitans sp. G128]|uniref:STAS domain-containing protein n=1 Tax=Aquihabitans sp. G128 TaxID=2849779 RepID=UPI001C2140BF|nr:STAS domain-containing protein [Aquihabitans sp. G128]QXC60107.1 STAS domain-containing protein [Aquihabitans sp. G128]